MDENESGDTGEDSKATQSTKSTRGSVSLSRLSKRRVKGIKEEVEFNKNGQPIGKIAIEMQSYIGVLARKEIKISYKKWKLVPKEVKDTIWELVNVSFGILRYYVTDFTFLLFE